VNNQNQHKDNTQYFFSIIIPTRNRAQMLARALESIVQQHLASIEVIVINDGSTEAYEHTLAQYSNIITHYHVNTHCEGVSAARNIGIRLATGTWTLFLDDDDEIAPNYLRYVKNHIESHNIDLAFLWSWIKKIHYSEIGDTIDESYVTYPLAAEHKNSKESIYNVAWAIGASYGLVINRVVYQKAGMFDTGYPVGEDAELVIRFMAMDITPISLPVIGVLKHEHAEERLSQSFNIYSNLYIYENICDKHSEFLQEYPVVYKNILGWCAKVHYRNRNYIAGDKALRTLITMKPLTVTCIKKYFEISLVKFIVKLNSRGVLGANFPLFYESRKSNLKSNN
jgi:glycosyltransferase involved in cell wall biosynthesis